MRCIYHPETEAVAICSTCGKPMCRECLINVKGMYYCPDCLESRVRGRPVKHHPFWLFAFSLIPGAGHLYLGLMNRGFQLMIFFFGTLFLFMEFLGDPLDTLWPVAVAPVTWFYSFFDARRLGQRIREGEDVRDEQVYDVSALRNNPRFWGQTLIAVGVLVFLMQFFRDVLPRVLASLMPGIGYGWYASRSLLSAIILIGVGTWILVANFKQSSGNPSRKAGSAPSDAE